MEHYTNQIFKIDKEEEKRREMFRLEKEMKRLDPVNTPGRKAIYGILQKKLKKLSRKKI